jgi:3-deoxy-D-manno-octulosonate 8-phosphate phosphatase (KDO 8-P phosphatase)
MASLGVNHVFQGQQDKLPAFLELLGRLGLDSSQAAYVGDDVVDLPIMCRTGLAIAVQDAHALVCQHAHWQTRLAGGRGAAREVCELIMAAQGSLDAVLQKYIDIPA